MLDMGKKQYGDCLLITHNERTILIDGAHPGDENLLKPQFRKILKKAPPYDIDLLIVTHCHSDHIGCLPALVKSGTIIVKKALVADEGLGWGRDTNGDSPSDAAKNDSEKMLLAVMQEEDHSNLDDLQLMEFFEDAGTLEEKYIEMLEKFASDGVSVIRYGKHKPSDIGRLEGEFRDFGLQVIGPSIDHLVICAEVITRASDSVINEVRSRGESDSIENSIEIYRQMVKRERIGDAEMFEEDRPGAGAARNNQSIVISLQADDWKALLTGDMQFAKPEVTGLKNEMKALREYIAGQGPYDFIKLAHHSSYNAVDDSCLDEWADTTLFAHTGGSDDPSHPEEDVLELLKARARSSGLQLARTDRNGIIKISKNGRVTMDPSKGRLNNFTPNIREDVSEEITETSRQILRPNNVQQSSEDFVEVHTKVPHVKTTVTVTIEVDPGQHDLQPQGGQSSMTSGKTNQSLPAPDKKKVPVSDSRKLPELLFVTSSKKLARNIGSAETSQVLNFIQQSLNGTVCDLDTNITKVQDAADKVRSVLKGSKFKGVVLVGGYDVVPPNRIDTVDAALRSRIVQSGYGKKDADNFIVWSDDVYGDTDSDALPELPVSRIPDGKTADLVMAALNASRPNLGSRFGIRNLARPFANDVFQVLPGTGALEVCQHYGPGNIQAGIAQGAVYYMLHGSYRDATRFWGEDNDRENIDAIELGNVPDNCNGTVVFTGCCWGALIASPPAVTMTPIEQLRPRLPQSSIALKYLAGGANAFIGCTGSHYSPVVPPLDYYGGPLHNTFWAKLLSGQSPAQALFEAKTEYVGNIPHRRTDPYSEGIELKIFNQFTCLGLGW